jgi:hypothetical protein
MTTPSRKDVMRPYEYLAIAAGIALFSGIVMFATTRDLVIAGVGLGIIFIITLMSLALLALAMKPSDSELNDLEAQSRNDDGPSAH